MLPESKKFGLQAIILTLKTKKNGFGFEFQYPTRSEHHLDQSL